MLNNKENEVQGLSTQLRSINGKFDYPLGIIAHERQSRLMIGLKYDGALLIKTKAQRLLNQMHHILQQLPATLEESLHAL